MSADPILPGQTIGILGGGQLGRMFTIAARQMGYRVHTMDPTSDCPTGQIADLQITASYDDVEAARQFAHGVDVVTFEFENVPASTLAAIEEIRPVHPSPQTLDTCRHRLHEKDFLTRHGLPVARYQRVSNVDELRAARESLGANCILKSAEFGYDGKGQVQLSSGIDLDRAWKLMGRSIGVVEAFVNFEREISVIVARTAGGECKTFEPFGNDHRNHILDTTVCPADLPPAVTRQAIELATTIAESFELVGVLAVEMFLQRDGTLLVNELAPRPHNSGHLTIDACVTSQFEQQLRAICGLPLGDPTLLTPAAMANLLGDVWQTGEPNWPAALKHPAVHLHLYGKHTPKPGRKMGHLTATARTSAEARNRVELARRELVIK
ncbi:MAG: 5-(carboxyamino)imidazole ribonucleotide synthase [Phycisphaerae bacterium]|nr:5-(carboxyamino)imidazole ribonucleotide synthase [Phycisphaerae bacterium]